MPGPRDRGQHDRREHGGKAKVKSAQAHDELLGPAAPRGREQARAPTPKARPMPDGDDADQRCVELRADQQQRDDVAAERVGAQPVRGRRRPQLARRCRSRSADYGVQTQRQQRRPSTSRLSAPRRRNAVRARRQKLAARRSGAATVDGGARGCS